ncbi:integrase catalytic domain-containing protein [Trichonephila clavipes]|nr:integrase catalytic domain-containing protein [Trichonephila clavipes]
MFASSSYVNPTPLAHADTSRDVLPRGDKGIHWKFIVERAPWWGRFYERLLKTIKDSLCKIFGKALLKFEELSMILSEVEVIVNYRPLTYVENGPGVLEPHSHRPTSSIWLWRL